MLPELEEKTILKLGEPKKVCVWHPRIGKEYPLGFHGPHVYNQQQVRGFYVGVDDKSRFIFLSLSNSGGELKVYRGLEDKTARYLSDDEEGPFIPFVQTEEAEFKMGESEKAHAIKLIRRYILNRDFGPINHSITLKDLEHAIRDSWSKETAYPADQDSWSTIISSKGQCAVTTLVLQDYLGGKIVYSENPYHFWLEKEGLDIDITRCQFDPKTIVRKKGYKLRDQVLEEGNAKEAKTLERYLLLKESVEKKLSSLSQ